jgi:hypothetical protein
MKATVSPSDRKSYFLRAGSHFGGLLRSPNVSSGSPGVDRPSPHTKYCAPSGPTSRMFFLVQSAPK